MPTFYNYTENGVAYPFDDVFVPADAFRQGNLWTWGFNDYAQLGINDTTLRNTPVTTVAGGGNWKQVAFCSFRLAAAIKTDGTLWTWGRNSYGELGVNNTFARCTPVTTFAGGTNWKQVACGNRHTAAIKTDGTLWSWGFNPNGGLGTNDTTFRSTPVTTFAGGTNWKQVACGDVRTAAIKTDGTLWTWGRNDYGGLGVNDTTFRVTPVTTFAGGTNWKQVSCGYRYAAAIKTDGTLWVWGRNDYGQIGINLSGITTGRSTPVTTFAGGTNWKQVSCGDDHIAAIKTNGTLWSWGYNYFGQLGDDVLGLNQQKTPATTFAGGTNWKQVSGGNGNTAAIKTDGTLWIWGYNGNGTLGINAQTSSRRTPITTFAGGTNWKEVACGDSTTAAITYIDDYQ